MRLELEDLVFFEAQFFQGTSQLTLLSRALLVTRDGIHEWWWSTHEEVGVLSWLRSVGSEEVLADQASFTLEIAFWLFDKVGDLDLIWVLLLQTVQFVLDKNIARRLVGVEQVHLSLVLWVLGNTSQQLEQRRDTRATTKQGDAVVLVWLPLVLLDRSLER